MKIICFKISREQLVQIKELIDRNIYTTLNEFIRESLQNFFQNLISNEHILELISYYKEKISYHDSYRTSVSMKITQPWLEVIGKQILYSNINSRAEFIKISIEILLDDFRETGEFIKSISYQIDHFNVSNFLKDFGINPNIETDECLLCKRKINKGNICKACFEEVNK